MEKNQSNRIIKPQKREHSKKNSSKNFKNNKVQDTFKSTKRNTSPVIEVNKKRKTYKRNKTIKKSIKMPVISFKFDKLKLIEIITKLQIGFVIIIILMILFNKFDVLQYLIKDEISVFGESSSQKDSTEKSNNVDLANIDDVEIEGDNKNILGTSDVSFESETNTVNNSIISYMKGSSYDEIFRNTYVVDSRAGVENSMFDFEAFENTDLTLKEPTETEPKVLIFHTHGSEKYIDSSGIEEGVYLLGETLEKELEEKYGINTVHIEKRYDQVDGQTQILGAYERMEPDVRAMLEKYPSIEVCIDIHRDGLPDDMKQTITIDGVDYAPLMFVNGLSSYNNNGTPEPLSDLENPNLEDNLAFSYRLKQATNSLYTGLVKDIYINAYRYSLHMKPKSLLLEVGAQNNTVDESVRSTKKFAGILAGVLKGDM